MKQLILAALATVSLTAIATGQAVQAGGTLTITTPNTSDTFTVEVGPLPGLVRIFTAPGIPDGRTFFGVNNLVIRTNGGDDKVFVKVESTVVPAMDIHTGAGASEVDVAIKVQPVASAVSTIRVQGSDLDDKVVLNADSSAQSLRTNWTVLLGAGNNEGSSIVVSGPRSRESLHSLSVVGGAGVDRWESIHDMKATTLTGSYNVNLGGGDDEMILRGKGNGSSRSEMTSNIQLGAGFDKLDVELTDVLTTLATGQMQTGAQDDLLSAKFDGTLLGNLSLGTGDGNDVLFLIAGLVNGSPRIHMGNGNDVTEFLAPSVFSGSPLSDGGAGFDQFKGIGQAINYEQFN